MLDHIAQDICFGHDANEVLSLHDGKTADVFFYHPTGGLLDRGTGGDRDDGFAHHLADPDRSHQILLLALSEAEDLYQSGVEKIALAQYPNDPSLLENREVADAAERHNVISDIQDIVALQGDWGFRHDVLDSYVFLQRHLRLLNSPSSMRSFATGSAKY